MCVAFDHRASPDGVRNFKDCIACCPFVETTVEVSGTYDLIVQGSCSSLAEYTENMERIRPHIAEFVTRLEANFVSKRVERHRPKEESEVLWLPCEDGHKRVETRMIDKIEAEGDYMRVHVGDWNCLVHDTLCRLSKRLGSSVFVKLHRSSLVRIDFIDRLVHHQRRWTARLVDGSHVSVAKGRVQEVLRLIAVEPPKPSADEMQKAELITAA